MEALGGGAPRALGRPLTPDELAQFQKYLLLLLKWQKVQRLMGSADPVWIIERLFLDSLLFLQVIPTEAVEVADLGSGSGIPGIPIKIVRSDICLTLIESQQRRVSFLSTAIRELNLKDVHVVGCRAEEMPGRCHGTFDALLARSAGDASAVLPVATRLVKPGAPVILSDAPDRRPLDGGTRVDVPAIRAGGTRAFSVYRRSL
jgi:16S rRNA (guanine527-N7)-methyltransferase